jgi:hypothetical protein
VPLESGSCGLSAPQRIARDVCNSAGWMRHVLVILGAIAAVGCSSPRVEEESAGRAGRDTRASAPQGPAPAPLRRSQLTLGDRTGWRSVLNWPDDCEEAFQASHAGDDAGLVFNELSPGISFVEVLCAAGAYQPSFVYVRLDERSTVPIARLLIFPVYESSDGVSIESARASEIWGEPFVSSARRELAILNLARQTGDCGIWTRYNIGGELPEMVDARRAPCAARPEAPATSSNGEPPRGWQPVNVRQ